MVTPGLPVDICVSTVKHDQPQRREISINSLMITYEIERQNMLSILYTYTAVTLKIWKKNIIGTEKRF